MARIRTVKPEFFTSEDIVSLSCWARLLFVAMWCEADREGRMYWKPNTFKMRYFPADSIDIKALCDELTGRDLVRLYGDGLAYIPTFSRHQHINPRESQSNLPDPDASSRVKHASARVSDVQGGREGRKGREDASFDAFWALYPNKASKEAARKAWAKINPNERLQVSIFEAVRRAATSRDWLKDEGQFVPHGATWLNGKRWEDDAPVKSALTAGGI